MSDQEHAERIYRDMQENQQCGAVTQIKAGIAKGRVLQLAELIELAYQNKATLVAEWLEAQEP